MPEEDLKRFLTEQNSIIRELGAFGGRPRKRDVVINVSFMLVVVACFVMSLCTQEEFWQRLLLEAGILLISAKIALFLWHFARVAHFQFWALVALETKLDILTNLSNDLKRHAEDSAGKGKGNEARADS